MSGAANMLALPLQRSIDRGLDDKPCGRCNGGHMTKECPMSPSHGYKGTIWSQITKNVRRTADMYLAQHPSYNPIASAPPPAPPQTRPQTTNASASGLAISSNRFDINGSTTQQQPGGAPSSGRTQASQPRKYPKSFMAVAEYTNGNRSMDMYHPEAKDLSQQTPTGDGKEWTRPSTLDDRHEVLKIRKPLFPLRKNYFVDTKGKGKTILTNHFEYTLKADTFYEYEILDLGTTNRKTLRAMYRYAIDNWPVLQQNQDSFATNYIDRIIAWEPLHDVDNNVVESSHNITLGIMPASVHFRLIKTVDATVLSQYAAADPNYETMNFENVAKCLNIVISKSLGADVHKLSSNKFFVKSARASLVGKNGTISNQLEIIRGYFYTVKPGTGTMILNFNISTSAVFRPIGVDDFLYGNNTFPADKLEQILKSKFVYLENKRKDKDAKKEAKLNAEESRYWKIWEVQTEGNIEDLTFDKKTYDAVTGEPLTNTDGSFATTRVHVIDHLEQVFGTRPQEGRPAVNVGTRYNPVWYAVEHLRIVPYQPYTRPVPPEFTASMVDQACRDPQVTRAYIENEGLASLGFAANTGEADFAASIPVRLSPTMLQVPQSALGKPSVTYLKDGIPCQRPGQSSWNVDKRFMTTFLVPGGERYKNDNVFKYAIIRGEGTYPNDIQTYQSHLESHFKLCGLQTTKVVRLADNVCSPQLTSITRDKMEVKLKEAKVNGAKIVFLLLSKPDSASYCIFKDLADRKVGIHAICMTKKGGNPKIFQNIMMKVNLKLGGVNHGVQSIFSKTMVLGGDLIHLGPGAFPGTTSIAAIVGSVDRAGGKCLGSLRLQDVHKTDREIMDYSSVKEMVLERLQAFFIHRGTLPKNILYYRDGASIGHYNAVRDTELLAIGDAFDTAKAIIKECSEGKQIINYQVRLTAIIVTKRHHTRFYPQKEAEGDGWGDQNTHPGTCVDKVVTSPYYQDFFLQSRSGIKGTARPTHYFVLQHDIEGVSLQNLCDWTHSLCYSYVRAMCGVSYASPTYYADRLCERGRLYLRKYFNGDDDQLWKDFKSTKKAKLDVQASTRRTQFGGGLRQKTKVHKAAEAAHDKQTEKEMKDFIFNKIKSDFYKQNGNNPIHPDVRETMWWM